MCSNSHQAKHTTSSFVVWAWALKNSWLWKHFTTTLQDQDAISLKFWSSFFSTKYTILGANLSTKAFSKTAPKLVDKLYPQIATQVRNNCNTCMHYQLLGRCKNMTSSSFHQTIYTEWVKSSFKQKIWHLKFWPLELIIWLGFTKFSEEFPY